MPRKSPAERAASLWRSGVHPPQPPRHLGRAARDHWQQVVKSRAPDYFDGAAQGLLANYCSALAAADRVAAAMAVSEPGTPQSAQLTKDYAALVGIASSLARSLRLTKQAQLRNDAGEHTERGAEQDPLIGGNVTPLHRPR